VQEPDLRTIVNNGCLTLQLLLMQVLNTLYVCIFILAGVPGVARGNVGKPHLAPLTPLLNPLADLMT
jgi:hypothetical protein